MSAEREGGGSVGFLGGGTVWGLPVLFLNLIWVSVFSAHWHCSKCEMRGSLMPLLIVR